VITQRGIESEDVSGAAGDQGSGILAPHNTMATKLHGYEFTLVL
jgi:hypothetical protein